MRELQTKFPKGKVVRDRYIVEELLGTGGFGAVYRVRDRRVRSNVFALKELIEPNAYERDNFVFECDLLRRLDHHALPRVYRGFEDAKNNRLYMLMDYIDGVNLEKLRQSQPEKRFALPQTLKMMAPIIAALAYLHTQAPPIIHRDIKPANIIVSSTGEGAVLVDFGIAKVYEQDSTTTAVRHCSPGYGSPEHYAWGTNTRTDIYSLGATFYALLTGTVPIDVLYRMTQLSSKGLDPLKTAHLVAPDVSEAVADVLTRAMAINSNDRFATVEEFWEALKKAAPEVPMEALSGQAISLELPAVKVRHIPLHPPGSSSVLYTTVPHVTGNNGLLGAISSGRRRVFIWSFIVLTLVAMLTGMLLGADGWPGRATGQSIATGKTVVKATRTAIIQHAATTVTTITPPTMLGDYPVLVGSYHGKILDRYTHPPTNTSMSLVQLQQDGATIKGYFSLGPGLLGDGDFHGSVAVDNKIQFLVIPSNGLLPLFFTGQIAIDGSMAGQYCSYQDDRCDYTQGGYGDWNVLPTIIYH